jgi:hypothetical protein
MPEQKPQLPRVIIFRPAAHDKLSIRLAEQSIEEAKKALELPRPSIFLGERHRDPFPTEKDE